MTMQYEKALDRVKKLLKLSRSDNEHEAAQAAAKAAALMSEFQLSEAMLSIDDEVERKPEKIVDGAPVEGTYDWKKRHKRVAWKGTIAYGVSQSLGMRYFWKNGQILGFGRESAVQAWSYMCQYLFREVDRLSDEAWLRAGQFTGQSIKAWKNAFRVGAAVTIQDRLLEERQAEVERRKQRKEAALAPADDDDAIDPVDSTNMGKALMIVEKDEAEVEAAYAERAKKFTNKLGAIGTVSSQSGFDAGQEAGKSIALGRKRAGLPEGQRRIGRE